MVYVVTSSELVESCRLTHGGMIVLNGRWRMHKSISRKVIKEGKQPSD